MPLPKVIVLTVPGDVDPGYARRLFVDAIDASLERSWNPQLADLANSARLLDLEAMRRSIDETHDHEADEEPLCSVCAHDEGYNAALRGVAGV